MSPAEWIIAIIVAVLMAAGGIGVVRLRKSVGVNLPGRMCSGCPHTSGTDKKEDSAE